LGESWQEKVDFFRKAVTGIIGGPPSFTGWAHPFIFYKKGIRVWTLREENIGYLHGPLKWAKQLMVPWAEFQWMGYRPKLFKRGGERESKRDNAESWLMDYTVIIPIYQFISPDNLQRHFSVAGSQFTRRRGWVFCQKFHIKLCLDLLKSTLYKKRFPVTSNLRYMYGVLNVDKIKN
jgi:hypothetical protein